MILNQENDLNETLKLIPNQDFKLIRNIKSQIFSGISVVQNNKLGGRIESIKFIDSVEPNTIKQFIAEAEILSVLNHPNIPKVYDIIELDGKLLYRSEYIEGFSLHEILEEFKNRNIKIPNITATHIIKELTDALNYTHNQFKFKGAKVSLIHCDIKPSNIIISSKNYTPKDKIDDEFIKLVINNKIKANLIDFGIAQFKGKTHQNKGTLHFMSPAQVGFDKSEVDWRSDIHQLGLVYYNILTNKIPYHNLSKSEILENKKTKDFRIKKSKKEISQNKKKLITKATKREPQDSFNTEKEFSKSLNKIHIKDSINYWFKKNNKIIFGILFTIILIITSINAHTYWDYKTQSVNALASKIENNQNMELEELNQILDKIQKRSFEKKYYNPLIEGKFRDQETGKPLYPSYVDQNGEWILTVPEYGSAGAFVAILFNQAKEYTELESYALEYTEPIYNSEYNSIETNRFIYSLIPAYEYTKDEKYLIKLKEISHNFIEEAKSRKGMTQLSDIYISKLYRRLFEFTGKKIYIANYEYILNEIINNNIYDGYLYESTTVNFSIPGYGKIPDTRSNRAITEIDSYSIGNFIPDSSDNNSYKKYTSANSRNYATLIYELNEAYKLTQNEKYKITLNSVFNYYNSVNKIDYFFVSNINEVSNIPIDSYSSMIFAKYYQDFNAEEYNDKLKETLTKYLIRNENKNGIIHSSVNLNGINYEHHNNDNRNTTIIFTDKEFLEI